MSRNQHRINCICRLLKGGKFPIDIPGEKVDIDQLDWKIIETYAADVRLSSLAMAKKLHVSADTIRNRIRNLEKNRIMMQIIKVRPRRIRIE